MALQAFVTSVSGTNVRAPLGDIDDAFVAAGVTIASTDTTTIIGTGSLQNVDVLGTVVGFSRAILLGNSATDVDNSVYIGASGYVGNYTVGNFAIRMIGSASTIENEGSIVGKSSGVSLGGNSDTTVSTLINSGLIKAKGTAVAQIGTETTVIENSGTIQGIFSDLNGGVSRIVNTGKFIGGVNLGIGDDLFDTREGSFSGIANGGDGADRLYGSIKADTFNGGNDNDTLYGFDGNDLLDGGSGDDAISGGGGNDQITGGLGKDALRGGSGTDQFILSDATDSTKATAGRDLILDFSQSQRDKINLALIDARVGGAADDSFTFVGKNSFGGNEGELRYGNSTGVTKISGDLDGDGIADFSIWIDGTVTLTASDFVL